MIANSLYSLKQNNLSEKIIAEYALISKEFSKFQNENQLPCPSGCGKCCFKSDIYCTPIEMLPLALDLMKRNVAEETYEKCNNYEGEQCMFMAIEDRTSGKGKCTEYNFRPLVCRIFGVAGRREKTGKMGFSVCSTLREVHEEEFAKFENKVFLDEDIPAIGLVKKNLMGLDPRFLETEYPINISLKMILEKILMESSFQD